MIESKDHDGKFDIVSSMLPNFLDKATVDNWSLGVLAYEFLCGRPPFETEDEHQTYEKIKKVDVKYPSWMEPAAVDFISKLLVKDPKSRMPLSEVASHPFIQTHASAV